MGMFMSTMWNTLLGWDQKEFRILMLGLDAAGKTTLLYRLKLGEVRHTIPTIGFNVESVEYQNIKFTVWDVGGQTKLRPLWRHYITGTNALIFVVDSSDATRVELAREELFHLLQTMDDDAHVLVFCNKQDLPNALSATELSNKLCLKELRHREWFVQPCCATTGEGLVDGLDWLASTLKRQGRK